MHFTELEKGDFVVFLRMEGVQQRLTFALKKLASEVRLAIVTRKADILKKCYQKRGAKIRVIEVQQGERYSQRKTKIEQHFIENEPIFFDTDDNLKQMENYLTGLNYTKQISQAKPFFNVNFCITEVEYVPSNEADLKNMLFSVCSGYFPKDMVDNLYHHKKEHLCYRLNYFASIVLRALTESYNFIVQIKEKDLHSLRNIMKRQLETVFTNEADRLFNIMQHEIICLVDQESYLSPEFPQIPASEEENIFKEHFALNKVVDPFSKSILGLLGVSSDKVIKEVIDSYIAWVNEVSPCKLRYLALYYRNCQSDSKTHLVNLLNAKLTIGAFNESFLVPKFEKVLNDSPSMDEGLLRITYLLFTISSIQLKKELDNVLNAQLALMYKVKFKLQLLSHRHNLPFEMTPQFLARFTESNYSNEFVSQTERSNPQIFPGLENHDRVMRVKKEGQRERVEVRRVIPENPLFEGKRILYREAMRQSQLVIEKLHCVCALVVGRRENYLHQETFTGIVDRYQLVHRLLSLELEYHLRKLTYLQELYSLFERSVDPEGLFLLAEKMHAVKRKDVFLSLDQPHFEERYANETELWTFKANLLSKLRAKQTSSEDEEKLKFHQAITKNNHVNNVPEISSQYYSDELAMENEDNIAEQAEEESLSQEMSESQFMMNSSKYRSDVSNISSEYHVKTTFKQILGRGSINTQQVQQNRREELMGKKKKKLFNDSILGGLLRYEDCNYYRYLHKVLGFIDQTEHLFQEVFDSSDLGVKREFYEEVCNIVEEADWDSMRGLALVDQNMLSRMLADCNRAISKVVEKYKTSSSHIEDYFFFKADIFQRLMENSTFANLNDLRGLYTCLNIVRLYKRYPDFILDKMLQQSFAKQLQIVCKKHGGESFTKDAKFLSFDVFLEKFAITAFLKLLDSPEPKSLLFISNNSTLANIVFVTQKAAAHYYEELLLNFYEEINDCKAFLANLELLETYGVYFDNLILSVTGTENRLYLRRKIEAVNDRLARLFKPKTIEEMVSLPSNCITMIKKQDCKPIESQAHLLENILMFEDFTCELAAAATVIAASADKLRLKVLQKSVGEKLQRTVKVLPFTNKLLQVKQTFPQLYKEIFLQNFKSSITFDKAAQGCIALDYNRMTVQSLNRILHRDSITDLKEFIRPLLQRKYQQFQLPDITLEKYYDYLDLQRPQHPYRLASEYQLKDLFDSRAEVDKKLSLLTWIQCKLLIFGASLKPEELLCFRSVLENIVENSHIFFRDESSRLVSYSDIVKMKIDNVDSATVVEKYIHAFLNFENLKSKYRSFLDGLAELNFNNQGSDIINIIYLANKNVFAYCNRTIPQYIANYCTQPAIKNETSHFVDFISKKNPNRYLRNALARVPSFTLFKTFLWNSSAIEGFKREIFFLQERCEILKQTLNSNNTKMKDITEELSIQLYTRERMRELYEFLQIPITKKSRIEYAHFLKKLQERLLLGEDKLNSTEKFLSKFIEKILKEKPELVGIKDEILEKIYESRFYSDLVLTRLINIATETLASELRLQQILFENYHQKELIRESKIIKSTLNKVLVPKIVINPYLESPLLLQNYFFAASLKLSYVDSFLNKLKNRAILVELAEGGFGFLLKITELDECIQSLCKGLITFAEKEFYDRFRTFLQSYRELKERYRKSVSHNQTLNNMIDVCRQECGKEIKSVIYSKLNSYLGTIHTKEKTYDSVFNIIKSLELEIAKKIESQYQARVHSLEQQNKQLKQQFIEYQKISARNTRTSMQYSKDTLYNSFKRQVENILNKEVVKDYVEAGEVEHEEQEEYTSTILLKRLRKQKLFYEMRINGLQAKLREKSNDIIKLKEELTTLDNTLTSEQFKNAKLTEEIRNMFEKNIEIEELKREIHKKQEQETLNKFKLIKVNEHLQGKITRLEEKSRLDTASVDKEPRKDERDFGVQTAAEQKKERRNFKIRTQHSQPIQSHNRVEQVPLWKQKWEASERKYHVLMSRIVQAFEVYRMNKNSMKLVERVGQMCEDCTSNSILRRKV